MKKQKPAAGKRLSLQWMTGTSMMIALTLVLANTPLGMIRMPFLTATTLHIPVILAVLVLGWEAGVITGFVFGIHSLISNLTGASFFAPFFINPMVSVLPRLLFPLCVYGVYRLASRLPGRSGRLTACVLASAIGTALHTTMVMGMIYLLNRERIAQMIASGAAVPQTLAERGVGMGVAALGMTNGIPEMIVAAVIAPVIALALDRALGRMRFRR